MRLNLGAAAEERCKSVACRAAALGARRRAQRTMLGGRNLSTISALSQQTMSGGCYLSAISADHVGRVR